MQRIFITPSGTLPSFVKLVSDQVLLSKSLNEFYYFKDRMKVQQCSVTTVPGRPELACFHAVFDRNILVLVSQTAESYSW